MSEAGAISLALEARDARLMPPAPLRPYHPPRGARPRLANVILETGTVKPDATKKPMALDFTILERDDAGKLQLGIVEMADDTATFALAPPGSTVRPTEFVSGGAAGVCLAKKVK